jgi:hypothetical protein
VRRSLETDIYAMKGKTTRSKPMVLVNVYVEVPRELVEAHQQTALCMDLMYIEEVPFLVMVSKYIKYITVRNSLARVGLKE